MTVDIKIAAGQRLMAGLPGTELDPGFVSLVRECKVGNVILFRRNVKSAAQLERPLLRAYLHDDVLRPNGLRTRGRAGKRATEKYQQHKRAETPAYLRHT